MAAITGNTSSHTQIVSEQSHTAAASRLGNVENTHEAPSARRSAITARHRVNYLTGRLCTSVIGCPSYALANAGIQWSMLVALKNLPGGLIGASFIASALGVNPFKGEVMAAMDAMAPKLSFKESPNGRLYSQRKLIDVLTNGVLDCLATIVAARISGTGRNDVQTQNQIPGIATEQNVSVPIAFALFLFKHFPTILAFAGVLAAMEFLLPRMLGGVATICLADGKYEPGLGNNWLPKPERRAKAWNHAKTVVGPLTSGLRLKMHLPTNREALVSYSDTWGARFPLLIASTLILLGIAAITGRVPYGQASIITALPFALLKIPKDPIRDKWVKKFKNRIGNGNNQSLLPVHNAPDGASHPETYPLTRVVSVPVPASDTNTAPLASMHPAPIQTMTEETARQKDRANTRSAVPAQKNSQSEGRPLDAFTAWLGEEGESSQAIPEDQNTLGKKEIVNESAVPGKESGNSEIQPLTAFNAWFNEENQQSQITSQHENIETKKSSYSDADVRKISSDTQSLKDGNGGRASIKPAPAEIPLPESDSNSSSSKA